MEKIILNAIHARDVSVEYVFEVSKGLKRYFSGKKFVIEYKEDIEKVPKAILSVPFVGSVLPIIWLTGAELYIEELDGEFYRSIPNIKQGYATMYPESTFTGKIRLCRQ